MTWRGRYFKLKHLSLKLFIGRWADAFVAISCGPLRNTCSVQYGVVMLAILTVPAQETRA
jgi:hypothetical protein